MYLVTVRTSSVPRHILSISFNCRFQSSSTTVKAVRGNTDKSDSQSKDSLSKYSQSKDYVIDEGKKLIVGSVEQVVSWCRTLSFLDSSKIIYQVYGTHVTNK